MFYFGNQSNSSRTSQASLSCEISRDLNLYAGERKPALSNAGELGPRELIRMTQTELAIF